jgi:TolB-like protein
MVFVIVRNSTFAYKGQSEDVRQIGRDLGVRYILEGSVRKSGQRVLRNGRLGHRIAAAEGLVEVRRTGSVVGAHRVVFWMSS